MTIIMVVRCATGDSGGRVSGGSDIACGGGSSVGGRDRGCGGSGDDGSGDEACGGGSGDDGSGDEACGGGSDAGGCGSCGSSDVMVVAVPVPVVVVVVVVPVVMVVAEMATTIVVVVIVVVTIAIVVLVTRNVIVKYNNVFQPILTTSNLTPKSLTLSTRLQRRPLARRASNVVAPQPRPPRIFVKEQKLMIGAGNVVTTIDTSRLYY
ncbi:hypothetical protein E2542_SST25148 [Spatholobus suberectus]|nr:hypothetical protein E2542_SST25148 [Spatholobus suberectus]